MEIEKQNIDFTYQIHYYFNDGSHTMDAVIQNKAEKSFIEVVKKISKELNLELNIEIMPLQEGGLREVFIFSIGILAGNIMNYFAPAFNDILTFHFTKNEEQIELDTKIKRETLNGIILDNKIKEENLKSIEIENKKKEAELKLTQLLDNKDIERGVSNYYKHLYSYEKLTYVSFQELNFNNKEQKVKKDSFQKYILEDIKLQRTDENAEIEIISPILTTDTYDWKGVYKGMLIDFSMGDTKFKEEVMSGKYKFANGSKINCVLHISTKYDKDNEIVGKEKYSVKSVSKVFDSIGERTPIKGKRKYKKDINDFQKSLFENNS